MKTRLHNPALLWVMVLLLSMGCASTYKPIDPKTIEYSAESSTKHFDFWYRYEALTYRGNKKYAKKEKKYGVNVVAVEITNKTDRTLNLARDFEFSTQRGPIYPTENETTAKRIRQGVAIYLLYALAYYSEVECVNNECETTTFIPFGLGLAAFNMILAGSANAKIRDEFNQYSLYGKEIGPGQTVHGIICLPETGYQSLSLKLKTND